ncbi:MAG: helix-turn-helix domain-containing protein [Actinomycetota bacterium]|nr:helix-turn-helix domain-containing protein [Actinomycetota bacterium]
MILRDFSQILTEDLGARYPLKGDESRAVSGLAVDEGAEGANGWLEPGEIVVSARKKLDDEFLNHAQKAGAPALIWRTNADLEEDTAKLVRKLDIGFFTLTPSVPLKRLFSVFSTGDELLLRSHTVSKTLLESAGGETSIESLAKEISDLLGRSIAVEDSVGRLLTFAGEPGVLADLLEETELRASKSTGIDETRRERRDRYARLPDGFLSVPIERWRVEDNELFWMPIGSGAPVGYLWMDLDGHSLTPEDVVLLYWARRILETELGKERVRLETELGARGDFVDDLVNGHYGSVDLLLQRARYLGADLSSGALTLIVDIDDFANYLERRKLKESAIQELKKRLADAVRLQTRQLFDNFLLGPRSDNVILFIGASGETSPEEIPDETRRLAGRIQRYVKGLLPDLTISIGIGRYIEDPSELPDAYSEAEVALEIGHRIHGPSSISTFEGAGTYKLLFRVLQEDPDELESFYNETLAPVVAYDSRYGTELVNTLTTYLRNDASTVKTATELFAHRHTIRYRLDRVGELTSLDVDKSEDRESLTLGIKVMQLLGRVPEKPSSFSDR